jgi:hypothetical protein
MHDDHRVCFPGVGRLLVANAAPEIDDLHAPVIRAAGTGQLVAAFEILCERLSHAFESASDMPLDDDAVRCGD